MVVEYGLDATGHVSVRGVGSATPRGMPVGPSPGSSSVSTG